MGLGDGICETLTENLVKTTDDVKKYFYQHDASCKNIRLLFIQRDQRGVFS